MASRPPTTILLLTRHIIVRADFNRDNKMASVWKEPRPDVQEWPLLVDFAIDLGPELGKNVFVMCSDLWTQTLNIGRAAKGMSESELASALNFEAESFSGHSAIESVVGFQTLPPGEGYWIVQARLGDLQHVDDAIHKAGSRLAGLLHPGGLPASLEPREARWARIEFWPDAAVLLRGDSHGTANVMVSNADPSMGRWKADWDQWRHGLGDKEFSQALAAPGMTPIPLGTEGTLQLDDDAALRRWLEGWSATLTAAIPRVPRVCPAKRPLSAGQRWGIAVGLAVAMLLLMALPYWWLSGTVNATQTELDAARAKLKRRDEQAKNHQAKIKQGIKDKESKLAISEKRLKNLESKKVKDVETTLIVREDFLRKLEQAVAAVEKQRRRFAKLLTKLGDHGIADLVVQTIGNEAGEPVLHGVCLQEKDADHLADLLARHLHDDGWEVQPAKKKIVDAADNLRRCDFEIVLRNNASMRVELQKAKSKGGK